MYVINKKELDLIDYMIISLEDGYAEYVYNKATLIQLKIRLRRESNISVLAIPQKEDNLKYTQIIPIDVYKNYNSRDLKVKQMFITKDDLLLNNNNYKYKYCYNNSILDEQIILKNYLSKVDLNNLSETIKISNDLNL